MGQQTSAQVAEIVVSWDEVDGEATHDYTVELLDEMSSDGQDQDNSSPAIPVLQIQSNDNNVDQENEEEEMVCFREPEEPKRDTGQELTVKERRRMIPQLDLFGPKDGGRRFANRRRHPRDDILTKYIQQTVELLFRIQ